MFLMEEHLQAKQTWEKLDEWIEGDAYIYTQVRFGGKSLRSDKWRSQIFRGHVACLSHSFQQEFARFSAITSGMKK